VDVRSGGGARPAVVCCRGLAESKDRDFFPALEDRLARAGFAVVTIDSVTDVGIVVDALARGDVGDVPTAVGVIGAGLGGSIARVRAVVTWGAEPGAPRRGGAPVLELQLPRPSAGPSLEYDQALDTTVSWFARHLT
jgi:hypothetical protein